MSLTQGAVEYRAHTTPPLPGPRRPRTNEHPDRRPPDDLTRRHPAHRRAGAAHLRGGRAREWIKLLSLRSTWWALASTAAVITLVAVNAMADDPALAPCRPRP
jgi:hypothetical protein